MKSLLATMEALETGWKLGESFENIFCRFLHLSFRLIPVHHLIRIDQTSQKTYVTCEKKRVLDAIDRYVVLHHVTKIVHTSKNNHM
jgi:hypothetical protein